MMRVASFILGVILLGTLTGWAGHWALHQRWTGFLHRAHLTHHMLYPPRKLLSSTYRKAGTDDTTFVLGPLIVVAVAIYLGVMVQAKASWLEIGTVVVTSLIIGWAHEALHEAFHLEAHWLSKFAWFRNLQAVHFAHHRYPKRNLGIVTMVWDRLFRTFRSG